MKFYKTLFIALLLLSTSLFAQKYPTLNIGQKMPMQQVKIFDISEESMTLNENIKSNGILVVFTSNSCPFVVMWEDRYKLVEEIAKENNLDLFYVNSNYKKRDGDDSFEKMQDHAKKMNYQFPYVLDKKSELANKFGAKTTPHIFLFSNENKLVYKGSIDDNHKDIKSVKKFYLKHAIKQLIAKETVELNETKAVGCSIKRYKL